jgi:galactokinase
MPESVEPRYTHACDLFNFKYGRGPQLLGVAPGRVELLGNHTDHNGGLVLSAAIDRVTLFAAASNGTDRVRIWSENVRDSDEFTLSNAAPLQRGSWSNYVRAVILGLNDAGIPLQGFDAVIHSDLPLGGGLSSSASLECAAAVALIELFGDATSPAPCGMKLAELLRQFEQRVVGVDCGILDQFSSLFGRSGHGLFLDCSTLEHDTTPLGATPPAIVVCDSGVSRQLATGKYNERRQECDATLKELCRICRPATAWRTLSEVSVTEFERCQSDLDPVLARRARHVLTENDRVRRGFRILSETGDLSQFARLLFDSHRSSRDDFENSSPQLDLLVEIASSLPGCLGAKLSGAGWGGCTVNLVEPHHADSFAGAISTEYSQRSGIQPRIMICQAADGAHAIRV